MKIVVTSATANECVGIQEQINPIYIDSSFRHRVMFHKSGVGMLSSTFTLTRLITDFQPDFIIQAGIAGAFTTSLLPGDVVVVKEDMPADIGVEEHGVFKDIFDMNLQDKNEFPFKDKKLKNPWLNEYNLIALPEITGVTVNEITTDSNRINHLLQNNAEVESMEGAALHYVCLQTKTPFLQLRAVSNYVGERDKSRWHIKPAINNLTSAVLQLIDRLCEENTDR